MLGRVWEESRQGWAHTPTPNISLEKSGMLKKNLEMNNAQQDQLHVKNILLLVRVLSQVHQLLQIRRIIFLTLARHIQGRNSHLS